MKIKFRVKYLGDDYDITWEDGKLIGDDHATEHARSLAKVMSVRVANLHPFEGSKRILADPNAVNRLCEMLFDSVEVIEGELPPLPGVPDGAVA